jgi:hypothetical protein
MELVVNDWRMSFFGSSGQYPGFRPLDLDDDGRAESSAYTAGAALVDASGAAPEPERRFSLTGNFVFQKARYLRIFVRGEVFDQLVGRAVAAEDREAVVAIDPDGRYRDLNNARISGASALDVRLLYQRRIDNAYWASRARVDR